MGKILVYDHVIGLKAYDTDLHWHNQFYMQDEARLKIMMEPDFVSRAHAIQIIPEDYALYQQIVETPRDSELFLACHNKRRSDEPWPVIFVTGNRKTIHFLRNCGAISPLKGCKPIGISIAKLASTWIGESKICACGKFSRLRDLQAAWREYSTVEKLYNLKFALCEPCQESGLILDIEGRGWVEVK